MGRRILIGDANVGDAATPGKQASRIVCSFYDLGTQYECKGKVELGSNQVYFQVNFEHGPWRGRGTTLQEARNEMLLIVPEEWQADMRLASQEAMYEAEDYLAESDLEA